MENIENAVQNESPAAETQIVNSEESKLDTKIVIEALEESDKALAKAEEKIVRMKKDAKKSSDGFADESLDEDIDAKIERLVEAKLSQKPERNDETLAELQNSRKKNSELLASLRSQKGISNSGAGSSQVQHEQEEDPKKGYSQADLVVLARVAGRKGLSLDDYLRTLKK